MYTVNILPSKVCVYKTVDDIQTESIIVLHNNDNYKMDILNF